MSEAWSQAGWVGRQWSGAVKNPGESRTVAPPYVFCAIKFTIILFRCLQWCYPNCTQLFFPLLQTEPVSIEPDTEKVASHTQPEWFGWSALLILHSLSSWKQQQPHGVIQHCTIKKSCYWHFFAFVLFFFIWVHSLCDSSFCRKISNYAQFYLPKQHKKTPVWVQM